MNCSTYLLCEDFDITELFFKTFIELGFINDAKIFDVENHKVIEFTTPSKDKMRFSHAPLRKELVDECRGCCHAVTSSFLSQAEPRRPQKIGVVLENHELIGSGYHSFVVNNDLIYDYAHNIVMFYEDYLKLINPKVLVYEDSSIVLSEMKALQEDEDFRNSELIDVLAYGISKQKCKVK